MTKLNDITLKVEALQADLKSQLPDIGVEGITATIGQRNIGIDNPYIVFKIESGFTSITKDLQQKDIEALAKFFNFLAS